MKQLITSVSRVFGSGLNVGCNLLLVYDWFTSNSRQSLFSRQAPVALQQASRQKPVRILVRVLQP